MEEKVHQQHVRVLVAVEGSSCWRGFTLASHYQRKGVYSTDMKIEEEEEKDGDRDRVIAFFSSSFLLTRDRVIGKYEFSLINSIIDSSFFAI